ncbi:hypothetical protein B566_EDAN012541 [Ephemera danica]|nr:hypothetical protein B566_EDAN012541 [Ephemera danica]
MSSQMKHHTSLHCLTDDALRDVRNDKEAHCPAPVKYATRRSELLEKLPACRADEDLVDQGLGNGGSICSGSGIAEGSSHLSDGSSVCSRGSIGQGGSDLSDNGGSNGGLNDSGLLVHNSVESVDGISSVFHNTTSTIGLNKGVRSLDNISVAGLSLSLAVSGQSILDVVGVRVLRVGVEVSVDSNGSLSNGGSIGQRSGIGSTSDGGGITEGSSYASHSRGGITEGSSHLSYRGGIGQRSCTVSGSSGVGSHGRGADDSSASHSNAGGEGEELQQKFTLIF